MDTRLSIDELTERLKSNTKNNYGFIYGVMKGATLANAAFTLTFFWSTDSLFSFLTLEFWILSFTAMVLTYTSTDIGTIMANWRLSWLDSVFPFLLAILEFTLFSVLQTTATVNVWYAVFAAYMFVIVILVNNAVRRAQIDQYKDSRLREFVDKVFLRQQRRDRANALLVCVVAAISALLEWWKVLLLPEALYWIPPLLILAGLITGIRDQERMRESIEKFVTASQHVNDRKRFIRRTPTHHG